MTDVLNSNQTEQIKEERTKRVLSRVALFLGELRDGLTMVSFRQLVIGNDVFSLTHTHFDYKFHLDFFDYFPLTLAFSYRIIPSFTRDID